MKKKLIDVLAKLFGVDPERLKTIKRVYIDMDGTLAEWKYSTHEVLYSEGYFITLKANKKLVRVIRFLIITGVADLLGIEFYILTSYLADSEFALKEKFLWVQEKIPELLYNIIFVPCGEPKTDYVEGTLTKDDYLLDDYKVNLHKWEGTSIKFLNGINSPWEGLSVRHNSVTLGIDLLKIILS